MDKATVEKSLRKIEEIRTLINGTLSPLYKNNEIRGRLRYLESVLNIELDMNRQRYVNSTKGRLKKYKKNG